MGATFIAATTGVHGQAGTIALAVSLVFLLFTIVITLALVPKPGERA